MSFDLLVSGCRESSESRLYGSREDIQVQITLDGWPNTRHKLLQYHWLMHTHVSPVKSYKFDSNNPDTSIKCSLERGMLIHCLWDCAKISRGIISNAIVEMFLTQRFLLWKCTQVPHVYRELNKFFFLIGAYNKQDL